MSESELSYEGLLRPIQLMRVLDGPRARGKGAGAPGESPEESALDKKVLEDYFHDLYGVFMKNLSFFIVEAESSSESNVKLQAMLQEMIKVKRLIGC